MPCISGSYLDPGNANIVIGVDNLPVCCIKIPSAPSVFPSQNHLLYVEQKHRDDKVKCRRSYHN
ncbi:hypothetical protein TSUD_20320 [Trifolium subterraneum]|uniref:Uncharacterized protein n=1 Tax=Trifolium subterraneum TaxID=3900 RepID=A0A2Z6NEG7_TRISU|nr:hypothetical protein TSUD_20320 [Trifolium subterraneum]